MRYQNDDGIRQPVCTPGERTMTIKQSRTTLRIARRKLMTASLAAGGAAWAGLAAPAIAQPVRVLRYGNQIQEGTVYNDACLLFAAELGKLSSGKLKVEVYPNSQLGPIAAMLSATQMGSLAMVQSSPAWYSPFMKPIDTFTLPFIVGSTERLRTALDGQIGKEIDKLAQAAGFKVIGYWLQGGRHLINNAHPINTPADCKGLKIRIPNSQVNIQMIRALGGNAVAMDPSELYLAMQQGVVDGFEFPLTDFVAFKLHEVSKFVSLDQHVTDFFIITMNKALWFGLSAEEQAMVTQAMRTAMEWQWVKQPKEIDEALAFIKTKLKVNDISPADREQFVQATRPIYAQFEAAIGKQFLELAIHDLAA